MQIKNDGHNLICKIKRKINQLLIELIFLIDFIFFSQLTKEIFNELKILKKTLYLKLIKIIKFNVYHFISEYQRIKKCCYLFNWTKRIFKNIYIIQYNENILIC